MKRKQPSICKINKSWHADRGANRDAIYPFAEITDRLKQGSNSSHLRKGGWGDPDLQPMPRVLRAPEPPRRRLAAGTPSILTARQINRGINFRETSSALRSSLQTRSLHIARSSKSRVRAPQQTWPCWLPKLPGESQKPSRHPHTGDNLGWKEVGQAWIDGNPHCDSRQHKVLSHSQ